MKQACHPPFAGMSTDLLSAAKSTLISISRRTSGRLTRESETAIFRVVQECLTNIHRHSGSPLAKIRLRQRDDQVMVEIEDKGKGIPPEKKEEMSSSGTPGVGIRGMRERLRQLGGTLEINSNGTGTVIVVSLPITETSSPSHTVAVTDTSPAAA
jgi:signal transduction histidine kinase